MKAALGAVRALSKSSSEPHKESMYVAVNSTLLAPPLCCQILGYGMLRIPLLVQHQNAASVGGCSLESRVVLEHSCTFLALISARLMKPTSSLTRGQISTGVLAAF